MSSADTADAESALNTSLWSVLAHYADFRRLFAGNSISVLGSSVTSVALPLTAVLYLHASASEMGLLGAAALLPYLALSLPAGVWVDLFPYKRVLVTTDLVQVLLLGSIPVLAAAGLLRLWQLYVVGLLAGSANLLEMVATQSFTPVLVPKRQLLPANSALMLTNAVSGTTGTAMAGFLVAALTAPIAIAVDAASFLLSGICKIRIRTVQPPVRSRREGRQRLHAEILDGLRAVFGQPLMRSLTTAATLGALAGQMQNVILILFLVRHVRLPTGLVGITVAAGGLAAVGGSLIVTAVTRRVGPGRTCILGMSIQSTAGLVLAVAPRMLPAAIAVVIVAQILRGTGPSLYGVNQQTLRQTLMPASMLARANASWRFLVFGTQVFGALLGGYLGSVLGLQLTLVVGSAVMFLGTSVAVLSPLRSLRKLPPAANSEAGAVRQAA
ncbi:MAG TPA: MFS transporter [Streptosporangiaceae bacterium]|nr:MFS transporter [Streptosporangiaceae bacterium]